MPFLVRNLWPCCLGLLAAGLSGCGGPGYDTVTLEGDFRVNGRPVVEGGITFSPLEADRGRGVYAEVRNGRYQARDVPVGKVHLTFMAIEYTGRNVTIMGETAPESTIIVPPAYRAGTDIEVSPGQTRRDVELTDDSPPGAPSTRR